MKEIDEGALDLVFSALQEDIYAFPIKSFVRETISNALDAVTEKKIALDIINNNAPVEKYFRLENDGELLKDSGWTPDYYNPEYLSEKDTVEVFYEESETGRDTIHITDYGVGLYGNRLKGYFTLGYSSKRNMKDLFGKFGLGNKVGLATGVEYFIVETRYNGYKSSFMVYRRDYEPITTQTPEGKHEVWKVKLSDGSIIDKIINWEKTDQMNGITISLPVKKHNKRAFIESVTKQFGYFGKRIFFKRPFMYTKGYKETYMEDTAIYETDNILISSYSSYSSPHIIVDGINYGLIPWNELELEDRRGPIGLKVNINEIDITQNRESLKYTDKTKKTILRRIEQAKEEASSYISKFATHDENDTFFKRIRSLLKITKNSNDDTAYKFSMFLNKTDIVPTFTLPEIPGVGDTVFSMDEKAFNFIFHYFNVHNVQGKEINHNLVIDKTIVSDWNDFVNSKIVFGEDTSLTKTKTKVLLDDLNVTRFIYIRPKSLKSEASIVLKDRIFSFDEDNFDFISNDVDVNIDTYEFDLSDPNDDEEIGDSTVIKGTKESLSAMRNRLQKMYFREYEYNSKYYNNRTKWNITHGEIAFSEIPNEFDNNTYITDNEYKGLAFLVLYLQKRFKIPDKVRVLFVAKSTFKHFAGHVKHITEYFKQYNRNSNSITMGESLKSLATAIKLGEVLDKYPYSYTLNRDFIDDISDINFKKYNSLINDHHFYNSDATLSRTRDNLRDLGKEEFQKIVDFIKNLMELQRIKDEEPEEVFKAKSKEFLNVTIENVDIYDKEFCDFVESEFKKYLPLRPFLDIVTFSYSGRKYDDSGTTYPEAVRKLSDKILNQIDFGDE